MIYFSYAVLIYVYCLCGHIVQNSGCLTHCIRCDDNSQQCQECLTGYYIDNNKQCSQCPERCSECSSSTQCSKCKPFLWKINCSSRCDHYCDESGCEDTYGNCYNCPIGFYGAYCDQNCSLCKNQLCDLRECREECINGYYKKTLAYSSYCMQCPQGCRICKSDVNCLECKKGFYKFYNYINGNLTSTCYNCQSNCEECSGYKECTACKPGTYGTSCENYCKISNCFRCIESEGNEACETCDNGYKLYEHKCVKCESNDGLCLMKCSDGYWGDNCDKTCPKDCNSCNQTNGICIVCQRDTYGDNCKFTCSDHCMDDGSIQNICDKDSGECELGCKGRYSGDKCELAPSLTPVKTDTITKDGSNERTHDNAERSTTTSYSKQTYKPQASQQNGAIIGAAAGGGVFIIIVVGTVVIVCIIRRR